MLSVQTRPSSHSSPLMHCGTGRFVLTGSQLHFDLVPGSACASSGQSVLLVFWRHVEHALTSNRPSPSTSAQFAVTLLTGIEISAPLATSPQKSPSFTVPPAGMVVTVQFAVAEVYAFGPI